MSRWTHEELDLLRKGIIPEGRTEDAARNARRKNGIKNVRKPRYNKGNRGRSHRPPDPTPAEIAAMKREIREKHYREMGLDWSVANT